MQIYSFVIDSYLKDSALTAVKRDPKVYNGYVKGVPFINRRCTKGVSFCRKWYIKGQRVGTKGGASRYKNFLSTPSGQFSRVLNATETKLANIQYCDFVITIRF